MRTSQPARSGGRPPGAGRAGRSRRRARRGPAARRCPRRSASAGWGASSTAQSPPRGANSTASPSASRSTCTAWRVPVSASLPVSGIQRSASTATSGRGRGEPLGRLGPDDDGAHVVGDHAVQLAGDVGAPSTTTFCASTARNRRALLTHERPQERGARHHEQRRTAPATSRSREPASGRRGRRTAPWVPARHTAPATSGLMAPRPRDQVSDGEDGHQVLRHG